MVKFYFTIELYRWILGVNDGTLHSCLKYIKKSSIPLNATFHNRTVVYFTANATSSSPQRIFTFPSSPTFICSFSDGVPAFEGFTFTRSASSF